MKNSLRFKFGGLVIASQYLCLSFLILSFLGCSDSNSHKEAINLKVSPLEMNFESSGGTQDLHLMFDGKIDLSDVHYQVSSSGKDWCSIAVEAEGIKVTVDPTDQNTDRSTTLIVTYEKTTLEVPITQKSSSDLRDLKIKIKSAIATTEEVTQEQRGIANSFDGDVNTYFNSKFGEFTNWPFQITYTLENSSPLDYIIYYPRMDSGTKYGALNTFEVWVSTDLNPTFTKVKAFSLQTNYSAPSILKFDETIKNVKQIRFNIYSAHNNRISCSEMEFFQTNINRFDYLKIFSDHSCSQLRDKVTESDIKKVPNETYKKLALALLNGTYNSDFRVADYRPFQDPSIMASLNKTSKYSLRDNPTGIYVNQDEEVIVCVGNTHGQNLSLVVQNLDLGYSSSKTYPLQEGENRLKMSIGGLLYIQNITTENVPLQLKTDVDKALAKSKTVRVHFPFGKVNGVFNTQTDSQQKFDELLSNAKYKDIDVLGKYVHVTWTVNDYKAAKTPILEVMDLIDSVVSLEWDLMLLFKYNKEFRNRMYVHVEYNSKNPYSSDYHTAYLPSYKGVFCTINELKNRVWVLGHEIGHNNQTRPGLKWAGTTEVTNNIMANYVRSSFGKGSRLMDKDTGITVYEQGVKTIVDGRQPHCLSNASDEFYMKLIPFWQLKLYIIDVLGQTDFYRDLYEHYRVTKNVNVSTDTEGVLQLDFVRQVCNIAHINFLDFFEKWGFLRSVSSTINDYGNKSFIVTDKQIADLRNEIEAKGYEKAPTNLYLITDENWTNYKK